MEAERRKGERFAFSRPIKAHLMAIDGTWRRSCEIIEISDGSANLHVEGSMEGLSMKEFFLVLSSTGLAYRRCSLAWVNGEQLGAWFLGKESKRAKAEIGDT